MIIASAVSWALASVASAQDFSPIGVRNYRPYSTLFLRFLPGRAPLATGQSELTLSGVAANSLNYTPNTLIGALAVEDIENDRLDIRYARGIGRGWEISAQAPIDAMGPGFLDPIISWYHRTFLRLHNIRNQVPYGGHTVYSPSGGPFSGGVGIGDLSMFASRSLGGETFLQAGLKLPTGDASKLLGSGGLDAGIYGQTTWKLARHFGLTADLGIVGQGAARHLAHTRALVVQGGATLAYAPNGRDTWLVQAAYEQSPNVEPIASLNKVEPSTTFGYRRRLSAKQSLTAYFMEDIDPVNSNFPIGANIGPDFVIGLVWNCRF